MQVLRFTQTNKKNGLQHKIRFAGRTKNLCFKFHFREISPKFEKSLKLQLN